MTEQSIFDILLANSTYRGDNKDDVSPLLIPDATDKISSVLGRNLKEIGNFSSWNVYLMLLHKLCMKKEPHNHVDSDNKTLFSDYLGKYYEKDEISEIIELYENEVMVKTRQFKENLKNCFNEKVKNNQLTWESIQDSVKELEQTSGLKFHSQHHRKILNVFSADITVYIKEINHQIKDEITNLEDYRLKHIQFGYAVLNIGSRNDVLKHLTFLFERLSEYNELYKYEKGFCKYLFKFIDQYPELLEFYCDKLFFTLEIQIIEICTFLICGTGEYFVFRLNEYLKSEDFNTLKAMCKQKDLLCSKVKMMLYNLYCSSRFNTRIMHLLNEISIALNSMKV